MSAARLRSAWLAGATLAGHATRIVRTVPGLAGAALIVVGLAQVYGPLGWIAAGVALVLLDRRMP